MAPKVVSGTIFLEISETLNFDDSRVRRGPRSMPKQKKNHEKVRPRTEDGQKATRGRENSPRVAKKVIAELKKNAKEHPGHGQGGPCDLTGLPRRGPDAVP